jgi:hypothetical protein
MTTTKWLDRSRSRMEMLRMRNNKLWCCEFYFTVLASISHRKAKHKLRTKKHEETQRTENSSDPKTYLVDVAKFGEVFPRV